MVFACLRTRAVPKSGLTALCRCKGLSTSWHRKLALEHKLSSAWFHYYQALGPPPSQGVAFASEACSARQSYHDTNEQCICYQLIEQRQSASRPVHSMWNKKTWIQMNIKYGKLLKQWCWMVDMKRRGPSNLWRLQLLHLFVFWQQFVLHWSNWYWSLDVLPRCSAMKIMPAKEWWIPTAMLINGSKVNATALRHSVLRVSNTRLSRHNRRRRWILYGLRFSPVKASTPVSIPYAELVCTSRTNLRTFLCRRCCNGRTSYSRSADWGLNRHSSAVDELRLPKTRNQ